jgi:hypothetical protein
MTPPNIESFNRGVLLILGDAYDAFPEDDMLILLTAISEAVERYNPAREAVTVIESEKGFEVSIVSATGRECVGGLFYSPDEV